MIIPNIQCLALKCAISDQCLGFENTTTGSVITNLEDLNENMFIRKEYFPLISKLDTLQIDGDKILFAKIINFRTYNGAQYNEGFNQDDNYFLGLSILQSMTQEKPICLEVIFNYTHNGYGYPIDRTAKNCGCYIDSNNKLKVGAEIYNDFDSGSLKKCNNDGSTSMDGSLFRKMGKALTEFWGDCYFSHPLVTATGYQIFLSYI
ncbi:hypothetical protein SNEBB_008755 [Seison nebaliae]|nr:hypothetical protein SNEBB_008755 [Seison nebaliae]